MLQRAASNAYSWWWASHIRTKQSKWLEQSLQDMEDKVQYMLKLIEEDGDSFAKRAEMYYKKRPELINFVEETYRAFRALAERYDKLSTELQNANNTLATCFPDQMQLAMDEDDEYNSPRIPRIPPQVPAANASSVPKVPKAPIKDLKGLLKTASKQLQSKKSSKTDSSDSSNPKSGLNKNEAVEEIDKLQKDILALQTVKEFVKSSYQSGLEKYWNIENQIMEKQQRVCCLQDEFGIDKVIEDDEARKLMAEAALKSCQETLAQLQETQQNSAREAKEESKKIVDARRRLKSIRHEYLHEQTDAEEMHYQNDDSTKTGDVTPSSSQDLGEVIQEMQEIEMVREKIKQQFDARSMSSITVTELAEKIDDLVSKVISLESAVSSQTVLIERLRSEAAQLHANIRTLEDDRVTLTEGKQGLSKRVKELEEKLNGIQDLNRNVESQNTNLQTHFAEAQCSLDHLSEKLCSMKPDDEPDSSKDQGRSHEDNISQEEQEKQNHLPDGSKGSVNLSEIGDTEVKEGQDSIVSMDREEGEGKVPSKKTVTFIDSKPQEKVEDNTKNAGEDVHNPESNVATENEELNWKMMLLSGVEDREKILLTEYTTILRNFKDVKRKLSDMEKKDRDGQFEVSMQIRELKNAIAKRDEEIQRLHRKLNVGVMESDFSTSDLSNDQRIKPEQRTEDADGNTFTGKDDEDFNFILINQPSAISPVEEKLRTDIDAILDENLDFWLRFSTAFHQIQKYKTTVEDLQNEISQIRDKKQQEGSASKNVKSDARPIYKHLKEIETELSLWLEQSVSLNDELEGRFSSLCNIQEKITLALNEGVEEEEIRFSSHQAAKFQGEVLNMKQENNKVRDELQAGVDHITSLQVEVDRTLRKLNEEFGLSGNQPQLGHSSSRSRIPLRSFIFGTKPKKQRPSIFSCIHPNRKYQVLRAGLPM